MVPGHSLVSVLGTNVTHVNVLQRLVRLHVADLHHEGMRSIVLPTDHQLRHHDGMVRGPSQRANPPLGGRQGRRVQGKGLVFGIPRRRQLETADVRTVTQFRLRITSDDPEVLRGLEEELVLLGSSLFSQSDLPHVLLVG